MAAPPVNDWSVDSGFQRHRVVPRVGPTCQWSGKGGGEILAKPPTCELWPRNSPPHLARGHWMGDAWTRAHRSVACVRGSGEAWWWGCVSTVKSLEGCEKAGFFFIARCNSRIKLDHAKYYAIMLLFFGLSVTYFLLSCFCFLFTKSPIFHFYLPDLCWRGFLGANAMGT